MKSYVGVTDFDWFELLRRQPDLEEVNFWQPGGSRQFKALAAGDLFLFKLHSPRNFVVGARIRDEFHNGREYYALHGRDLRKPERPDQALSEENINWHNEQVYLGA